MKSTTKLVMGATLITGVTLLLVMALLLVLVAELYCSLLLRKRRLLQTPNKTHTPSEQNKSEDPKKMPCSSSNAYAQGVLDPPPRSFLLGFGKEENNRELEPPRSIPTGTTYTNLHYFIGLVSTEEEEHVDVVEEKDVGSSNEEFVYISNPIYEEGCVVSSSTSFETPDTSPSRLEMEDGCSQVCYYSSPCSSSGPSVLTPPLTPMKKLPLTASSVTLIDGGSSLVASDSNVASSSSSDSPCTSPSW
ncbi:uncharacterized protein LOC143851070 [Tasmannia lanceolata]|uniref:uncharacterized protein LOC143851070 n=1 Tax=Tasmannia lanceolata TaxID=3420 RepID=UPI00406369B1